MNKGALIVTMLVSGVVLAACNAANPTQDVTQTNPQPASQPADAADPSGSELADVNEAGQYIEYSETAIAEATAGGNDAVLFFHAAWCPTCIAANRDFNSRLNEIPANLTIIKTDYDTYDDLKQQYGVTYQHTFVQVDADGNEITKWNGGSLDEILAQVQ